MLRLFIVAPLQLSTSPHCSHCPISHDGKSQEHWTRTREVADRPTVNPATPDCDLSSRPPPLTAENRRLLHFQMAPLAGRAAGVCGVQDQAPVVGSAWKELLTGMFGGLGRGGEREYRLISQARAVVCGGGKRTSGSSQCEHDGARGGFVQQTTFSPLKLRYLGGICILHQVLNLLTPKEVPVSALARSLLS